MPTALRIGGVRFFFYSADRDEPSHVHVEQARKSAKFWLDPVRAHKSRGFASHEIRRIERLVVNNRDLLLRSWDEYFKD